MIYKYFIEISSAYFRALFGHNFPVFSLNKATIRLKNNLFWPKIQKTINQTNFNKGLVSRLIFYDNRFFSLKDR